MTVRQIHLRGVRVHNLKNVDLDIPHRQLVVLCGMSGSGKTSLALDTLYAEGQRRYIESFSAYTRQFLDPFEKPDADRIEGIPPAIAVTRSNTARSSRSTVGTVTEVIDHLRLLFARVGTLVCPDCRRPVTRDSAQSVAAQVSAWPDGRRLLVTFPRAAPEPNGWAAVASALQEAGFVRIIVGGHLVRVDALPPDPHEAWGQPDERAFPVVVDRLVTGKLAPQRLQDSIETALRHGAGCCHLLVELEPGSGPDPSGGAEVQQIDQRPWQRWSFGETLRCEACDRSFAPPEPRLLSFNSPLGACPQCEGFGNVVDLDMDLIVPDPTKSLREGAIAPWNTPAYRHELTELLALADDWGIPVDVPFAELTESQVALIRDGVPEREFGGLRGFFQWLERRKYKMHLRVFLSRWRSARTCPACDGDRLRPESLALRVSGRNIAQLARMQVGQLRTFLAELTLPAATRPIAATILPQIDTRLRYLESVGLGYLTLDRTIRTLSGGEAQRVALTCALGSSLVNMLYVLDEPSIGLHPQDVDRLLRAITDLRDRRNTVVVVEHEPAMLWAADRLIEFGPAAGEQGGRVTFEGTLADMERGVPSLTGDYLFGRRGLSLAGPRRETNRGWITLKGARGNNLQNLTVEFPLGVLCLVTGVSGSGKSTLVQDTLYGALCRRKHKTGPKPYPYEDVYGDGQLDDVVMIDQSPIGRSPRSNPVTYIKAFDAIRAVFAETLEARTHNYSASHFSFNVDGGRCTNCKGDGFLRVDMQFLADVFMKCPECRGRRYRREILEVTYRGRNIADVLQMTVREAFAFFRGQRRVQVKLQRLLDVGLDYLRLGQPANTLSAGEAQRLKLAGHLATQGRRRSLIILDEPTTGLHFSDIVQLLDCFDSLLNVGHSLLIVEHNLQLMKAADYIVDLGPGPAERGGRVVVAGTPEQVAAHPESATGRFLAEALHAFAELPEDAP